jgi:hypothetical protein
MQCILHILQLVHHFILIITHCKKLMDIDMYSALIFPYCVCIYLYNLHISYKQKVYGNDCERLKCSTHTDVMRLTQTLPLVIGYSGISSF